MTKNNITWLYCVTSALDFKTDLSGLKLSLLVLATQALNYCVQKWEKHLGSRLFMFRTWIVRQCNTVRVRKLTDIVTSLWLGISKLDKELSNVIHVLGIKEYHIWNKWKYESVNKLLTVINHNRGRREEEEFIAG